MVTGTTRSSGQASIMATSTGRPAQLGQVFGVAGMAKARVLQGFLLDGVGHHAADIAAQGHLGGAFDRGHAGCGVPGIGTAGLDRRAERHRQDRQCVREDVGRFRRGGDGAQGDVQPKLAGEFG